MNSRFILHVFWCSLLYHGASGVDTDRVSVSVMKGDSVTLDTGVETNQQDRIRWSFIGTRIAEITGDLSLICTDVQCNEGTERFRDRLKLDHQTGSLTIMNTTNNDSGDYLHVSNGKDSNNKKTFSVTVHDGMTANVMEGDSVTLHTDVKMNHQDRIRWYCNKTLIAQITGDQSKICTVDQCKERFRDRLKLDSQTGDLTITDIRTTDAGVYKLQIISRRVIHKIFNVAVHSVAANEREKVKSKSVKEGESLILHPGVIKNPNHVMTWHFSDIPFAEITGDQSKICSDDERFRDRLELNNQTGSLTIMNTINTDSGEYKVNIVHSFSHRHRISIISIETFSVTVIDSSLPSGLIAGQCAAAVVSLVLLTFLAAACLKIYCSWCCNIADLTIVN